MRVDPAVTCAVSAGACEAPAVVQTVRRDDCPADGVSPEPTEGPASGLRCVRTSHTPAGPPLLGSHACGERITRPVAQRIPTGEPAGSYAPEHRLLDQSFTCLHDSTTVRDPARSREPRPPSRPKTAHRSSGWQRTGAGCPSWPGSRSDAPVEPCRSMPVHDVFSGQTG
jgi:hypothetical protein